MEVKPEWTVLVVDDDEVEQLAITRAFERAGLRAHLETASDGEAALARLRGEGPVPAVRRPNLILLDLRMPGMDGLEMLAELRADPELRDSVVFMLPTSELESDRAAAYAHQVAGYITKPRSDPEGFQQLVQLIARYGELVTLPS